MFNSQRTKKRKSVVNFNKESTSTFIDQQGAQVSE